jgi:hypothetical protein
MNWFPVEYEGTLTGFEHAPAIGGDNDYNFFISRDDNALYTIGATSVELEFDASETVDHFDGTRTWWDTFHHQFVDKNKQAAASLIKGKTAIVIGMLGLDLAHKNHHSELHPIYAMFINVSTSPTEDKWTFFVRNWGNEGFCGPDDVRISEKTIRVRLRQASGRPGVAGVGPPRLPVLKFKNVSPFSHDDKSKCSGNKWDFAPSSDGALLTFDLSDASKKCGFVGDLTIGWIAPSHTSRP